MTVILPQAFDHALLGAVEEELQRVGDIQLLQLREVHIALGVLPAQPNNITVLATTRHISS